MEGSNLKHTKIDPSSVDIFSSKIVIILYVNVCMYRGCPSWRCPWDWAFQLGQGEGRIGLVGPISQSRGTNGTSSLTLDHTYALMCAF